MSNQEFYNNRKRKIGDFLWGILINFAIVVVYFGMFWIAAIFDSRIMNIYDGNNALYFIVSGISFLFIVIIEFSSIKYFFKTRKFIAIGMLAFIFIPLLAVGLCSILIFG